MKRYKLLKDLPTFKAGQLAYISERGNLIAGTPDNPETTDARIQLMMYHKQTIDKFPEILTEWFEEVKEPTDSIHWNPSIGEKCFILENTNIRSTFKPDFKNDRGGYVVFYNPEEDKLETHNVYCYDYGEIVRYETVEEAEKSIKENREDWLIYFGIKEER